MRRGSLSFQNTKDHFLAGFLLIVGLFLLVNRNDDGLRSIRQVGISLYSYLEQPLSAIRVYRTALQTNTQLQQENILLNDELSRLRSAQDELEDLRRLLDLKGRMPFKLTPVNIVGKQRTVLYSSLTVDAGKEDSLEVGMSLVSSQGLVGRVIIVSDEYAQIMPYSNPLFRASARLQGTRAIGILSPSTIKLGLMELNYVPQTISVDEGAIVETSGYSFQFPQGIPIGEVVSVKPQQGRDYQTIFVRPFVPLNDLSEGFILHYQTDSSIVELQKSYSEIFK
jgi:rod shape-determining protein MreC